MRSSSATARAVALALVALLLSGGCARPRPAVPAPPRPDPLQLLRSSIDEVLDQPGHLKGIWGVSIQSLAGERLYQRNPQTLLVPASTMKLVSLAAAADAVGWDYTFETTVLAAGPIRDGALQGDLVIVGSGDPSILGRAADNSLASWIDALRAHGVSRIQGCIVADDDALEEPRPGFAWSWEDLGYTYGAMAGALNATENALAIKVFPGAVEGLPVVVELPPEARDLPIVSRARTAPAGSQGTVWPEFRPGEAVLTLNGTLAADAQPTDVSLAAGNPTQWFARAVRNRLIAGGIAVDGPPTDVDDLAAKPDWSGATIVHVHRSRPLAELARPLVKDSINLYAEALLRLATGATGVRTTDAGLEAARARLESWDIPRDGIQIVDGSGLSRRDVIAPETLVALLRRFYDPSGASPWMQAMAVAGRDGSLENRMKGTPAEGNAIGKTGSMSNIRTLAGYVKTADGEPLAFAIMANNFEGPASTVIAAIDAVVARLASFSRAATKNTKH